MSCLLEYFSFARYHLGERVLLENLTPRLLRSLYTEQQRSIAEIAEMLAYDPRRVSGLLHQWGVPARARGGRTVLSRRVLEELHVARGMTAEQIALRLGYLRASGEPAAERVREVLYRHGVNLPQSEREISDADLEALYVGGGLAGCTAPERAGVDQAPSYSTTCARSSARIRSPSGTSRRSLTPRATLASSI